MSIALCSILFAASADPQIYLGGTVRNGEGNAISQAKVCLLSDTTLRCYTDSAGKFIISNTAVFDKDLSSITLASDFRITGKKNNQFTFLLRTPVGNGNLAVFSANGKRCIFIPLGQIKPGIQNITLPGLAKGICLIKFTLDRQTFTCKLINTGNYIVLNKLAAQTKSQTILLCCHRRNCRYPSGNKEVSNRRKPLLIPTIKRPGDNHGPYQVDSYLCKGHAFH